jgi:hypothetical protein
MKQRTVFAPPHKGAGRRRKGNKKKRPKNWRMIFKRTTCYLTTSKSRMDVGWVSITTEPT